MTERTKIPMREVIPLLLINFKVKFYNFIDYIRTIFNYYGNFNFLKIDSYLIFSYLFRNPFLISKQFLLQKGEDEVDAYGETPLTTVELIAQECRLSAQDTVFELGCGRGRTCFWLNQFIGCRVVGIDYVPEFITRANEIKAKFNLNRVDFRKEDFLESDFNGATVIYLYGTCLPASTIEKLIEKFSQLPRGAKIITISFPLTDYTDTSLFEVMRRFPVKLTWGTTDAYLQIKK